MHDLDSNAGSKYLVKAVMEIATSVGLEVIAEGVETARPASLLSDLGCLHSQGYLHSKPLSTERLTALLGRDHPTAPLGLVTPVLIRSR